jgi:hypothetical protein
LDPFFFFIKLHNAVRFPKWDVEKKSGTRPDPHHMIKIKKEKKKREKKIEETPLITLVPHKTPLPSYFFFFSSRSRDFAAQHPLRPSLHFSPLFTLIFTSSSSSIFWLHQSPKPELSNTDLRLLSPFFLHFGNF